MSEGKTETNNTISIKELNESIGVLFVQWPSKARSFSIFHVNAVAHIL